MLKTRNNPKIHQRVNEKTNCQYIHTLEFYSAIKILTPDTCNNMYGSQKHKAK